MEKAIEMTAEGGRIAGKAKTGSINSQRRTRQNNNKDKTERAPRKREQRGRKQFCLRPFTHTNRKAGR